MNSSEDDPLVKNETLLEREKVISDYAQQERLHATEGIDLCKQGTVISIVVPAFNEEDGILDTLESIHNMDNSELVEVVVVDNGSTDRTMAIIEEYRQQYPRMNLTVLREPRKGVGFARKRGMDEVVAHYVKKSKYNEPRLLAMTDADSLLSKKWLLTVIETYEKLKIPVISGLYQYPDWYCDLRTLEPGTQLLHPQRKLRRALFESGAAFRNTDGRNSIIEIASYVSVGGIKQPLNDDGTPKYGEDFGVGIRWVSLGGKIGFLPESATVVTNPRRFVNWRLERIKTTQGNIILPNEYYNKDYRLDVHAAAKLLLAQESEDTIRNQDEAQIISALVHNIVKPILLGYHSPEKFIELFGENHPYVIDVLSNIDSATIPSDDHELTKFASDITKKHLLSIEPVLWELVSNWQ